MPEERTIWLRAHMAPAIARKVLAHEILHAIIAESRRQNPCFFVYFDRVEEELVSSIDEIFESLLSYIKPGWHR
jgi:hypothetical protein